MGITVAVVGLAVLATLPFSGPLLAGAGVAATAVATAANATVAAGLTIAGSSILVAAASTGGRRPTELGKEGEKQAGIDPSKKETIEINGRKRIPDEMKNEILKEVKNVKYISNTQQLKDFADYAKLLNYSLELVVRTTTKVAATVKEAGWKIIYLIT